jgi:hypothetical protein
MVERVIYYGNKKGLNYVKLIRWLRLSMDDYIHHD